MATHYCRKEEDERCVFCTLRTSRKEKVEAGIVPPFYIIAFEISRHYGGPEEGGWWYDWTTINEVRKVFTVAQAIKHVHELKEQYPKPRNNRYSVIGGADQYIQVCYSESDLRWPEETTRKPRYE